MLHELRRAAWACALLACGCGASVKKCKERTLFVQVTLEGAVSQADELLVDVALDGGSPVETQLTHRPGDKGGGLEIDFPSGYPSGHSARVDVIALVAGATVGSGEVTLDSLGQGCQSATLTVSGPQSGDQSMLGDAGSTDGGPDLAQPKPDLYSYDLAGADLVCIPSTEDCFNGVDDDCDGLADCADPDCTGGASPKAACVPDPGSFTAGTDVSPGPCPAGYPSPMPLGSGALTDSSCAVGTCACQALPSSPFCDGVLVDSGNSPGCGSGVSQITTTCLEGLSIPSGDYHAAGGPTWESPGCGSPTGGTASRVAASFAANDLFCSGSVVGAGCPGSERCVPAAPSHCVVRTGTQLTCPTGYNLRPVHYFADVTDSRTCTCDCGFATFGHCFSASLNFYTSSDCSGTPVGFATACTNNDATTVHSAQVIGSPSGGTCGATVDPAGGPAVAADEQTVCCTN
jgi:hypothetical protein